MTVVQLDNFRTHTTPLASAVRIGDFNQQFSDFHSLDLLPDKRAVVDAYNVERQEDLLSELKANGYEIILDTKGAELASAFKWNSQARKAEWLTEEPNGPLRPLDFNEDMARRIAHLTIKAGAHVVLAPSRYLSAASAIMTIQQDHEFTLLLRKALDSAGGQNISIAGSFIGRLTLLGDSEITGALTSVLVDTPASSLWMRLSGLKRDPAPGRIRTTARRLTELKETGLPIMLDYAVGLEPLTLLSLGAASGVSFGAMKNDQFSDATWVRPMKSQSNSLDEEEGRKQYARAPSLGRNLSQSEARLLSEAPQGKRLLLDPANSGLSSFEDLRKRAKEVALREASQSIKQLSETPDARRPEHAKTYLLEPAARRADQLSRLSLDLDRAAELKVDPDSLKRRLSKHAQQVSKTCDMLDVVQDKAETRASAPIRMPHNGAKTMTANSEDKR